MKRLLSELGLVLASVFAAVLLVAIGLWLAHYPALAVLREWTLGAVASRFDVAIGLKNACPLILTGLAAGVAFRCGVINIGAEGQSLMGALATVAFATELAPQLPAVLAIPLALLVALLAGGAWALMAGALDRYRGVPVVLSTILLNFIALKIVDALLSTVLKNKGSGVPQSYPVPDAYLLYHFPESSGLASLHAGIFIAVAVAMVAWLIQARTAFGYELRVTGLNPTAARLAGIPVASRQLSVMIFSGAFAGLAGAIQLIGINKVLNPDSPGIGYAGIAVALLGRLHPMGIILAALFFGMLDQGAANVEISSFALPHDVASIVKGIIVLGILIGTAFLSTRRSAAKEP